MLVADALDAVAAKAVLQQRGALERLAHGELGVRILLLEVVARAHGAGRTGGEAGAGEPVALATDGLERILDGLARDLIVPEGVAHLFKLVEDNHVLARAAQLPRLVEDLLDVGFAAGRGDDFAGNVGKPLEAFAAHLGRQDGDGIAGKQLGVEGAAAAVVAGGGPDGLVIGRVKLTGDQTRHETAERSADLVAAGGEPFAGEQDDARLDAGEFVRDLDEVDVAEDAAAFLGLVAPGDAEQVEGVEVPKPHIAEPGLDLIRDQVGIAHLRERRDDDALCTRALHAALQAVTVDGQIDHLLSSPSRYYRFGIQMESS